MGEKEDIKNIITGLKKKSGEIKNVLVFGKSFDIWTSEEVNFSKSEIAFSAVLGAVVKMVEDAMESVNMSCEELTIRSTESSVIVKRAGTVFVIVEVTGIIPARPPGLFTEGGPAGTTTNIDNAVDEIKTVLLKQ